MVGGRIPEAVDRGHRGHDDAVALLQQRLRRREPHLFDVVVDRGVLLYVGVRRGDVGFRLVVVVIGDEVLDGVAGKELAHLAVELCGQRLVGGEHQGRAARLLDDLRHRERLSGAGDAEQRLVGEPGPNPLDEPVDRGGLIAGGGEVGDDGEGPGFHAGFVLDSLTASRVPHSIPAPHSPVAQLVERVTVNHLVGGSSPSRGANGVAPVHGARSRRRGSRPLRPVLPATIAHRARSGADPLRPPAVPAKPENIHRIATAGRPDGGNSRKIPAMRPFPERWRESSSGPAPAQKKRDNVSCT